MEKGTRVLKESDYTEAVECFSRALEISRVAQYDELSFECLNAYYQYGRALLYKAQEADPLGSVPKMEGQSQQVSDKDESVKNIVYGDSSTASVLSNTEQDRAVDDVPGGEVEEEDEEGNDDEDFAEGDEDESDLDLAWKMLDVARAIAEKH